jgi:hypothetical protein
LCQSVCGKDYTNCSQFLLVSICFRKDLHQSQQISSCPSLFPQRPTPIAPDRSCANLLRKDLHLLLPGPVSSCANQFGEMLTSIVPSSCLRQSANLFTEAYASGTCLCRFLPAKSLHHLCSLFPACANLVSASLHHEGFLRVPICFCKYHIQFSFSIRINVTSTCATLHQQALYLSDIGTCMHGRTCVHCAPT